MKKSEPLWLVGSLTAISTLALIDKNILLLLAVPLKTDLSLSDTQIGLVIGLAFALVNITGSLPAGWMADRYNRKCLVAIGVVLWSCFTMGGSLALGFGGLFISRAGVGMSESLIPPAAISLIRDGVPANHRDRALSVYAMSTTIGTGVALALGGMIYSWVTGFDFGGVPVLRDLRPWAITLFLAGVSGFPFCLLLLSFREPVRTVGQRSSHLREGWREMIDHKGIYLPLMLFCVSQALSSMSVAAWEPSLMARKFGLGPVAIGLPVGLMLMTISPAGLYAVGWSQTYLRKRHHMPYGVVALIVTVITGSTTFAFPRAQSLEGTWALISINLLCSTAYLVIASTAVTEIAAPQNVGKTMAIFLLVQAAAGSGLGPVMVPMTERLLSQSLSEALSTLGVLYGIVGLFASLWLARNAAIRLSTLSAQNTERTEHL